MSRFDAWNASFRNEDFRYVRELLGKLGAELHPRKGGLHGYHSSESITIDGNNHGIVAWGGNSRSFVEVKGEPAQRWYEIVSPHLADDVDASTGEVLEPFVKLTRGDVCFDWLDDRDTKALAAGLMEAVRLAGGRPVSWDQRGDWITEEGRLRGCTLYMGASSSSVRLRLYDKGLEQRAKGHDADPSLRRLEVQVRPDKNFPPLAGTPPAFFWSMSTAVRAAANHVGIDTSGSMKRSYSERSEIEVQMLHASMQYGEAIIEMIRRSGASQSLIESVQGTVKKNAQTLKDLKRKAA